MKLKMGRRQFRRNGSLPQDTSDIKALATIPFEEELEDVKKRLMAKNSEPLPMSVGDCLCALNENKWMTSLIFLNAYFVFSHLFRVLYGAFPSYALLFALGNGFAAALLTRKVVQKWRKEEGERFQLTPAVKGYLKAHSEEEDALRRKVDGFNRALEARRDSNLLLENVDSEVREASDDAWRKQRADLRGDVDAYLSDIRRTHQHEAEREAEIGKLRDKAKAYKRLEAAMRQYPDSGGYDKTVDLSVYQEVAQALQEIEEEASSLGITLDDIGITATGLLTDGTQAT